MDRSLIEERQPKSIYQSSAHGVTLREIRLCSCKGKVHANSENNIFVAFVCRERSHIRQQSSTHMIRWNYFSQQTKLHKKTKEKIERKSVVVWRDTIEWQTMESDDVSHLSIDDNEQDNV